jgi:hypothetical protein
MNTEPERRIAWREEPIAAAVISAIQESAKQDGPRIQFVRERLQGTRLFEGVLLTDDSVWGAIRRHWRELWDTYKPGPRWV